MNKKSNNVFDLEEKFLQLEELKEWFEQNNSPDLNEAQIKYNQAQILLNQIGQYLESASAKIKEIQ